jgi:AAA family ATP:ADP antiporter
VFSLIWIYKITEKGTNYSLNNTIRGALFLPAGRCATYEGKTTIDAFFWRFGDLLQAGLIFIALNWLDFELTGVALITVCLALLMLLLSHKLGREYRSLASSPITDEPGEEN